jgi:TIR domain
MPKRDGVFISYRRIDTAAVAQLICHQLTAALGEGVVFLDVRHIDGGDQYPDVLLDELRRATALVVLIGDHWLIAADEFGNRRIDDPNDWVHIELSACLSDPDVLVIPVLLDAARIPPKQAQLPAPIDVLRVRSAVKVRTDQLSNDLVPLIEQLKSRLTKTVGGGW